MEVLKMFSIYRYKAAQIETNQPDKRQHRDGKQSIHEAVMVLLQNADGGKYIFFIISMEFHKNAERGKMCITNSCSADYKCVPPNTFEKSGKIQFERSQNV